MFVGQVFAGQVFVEQVFLDRYLLDRCFWTGICWNFIILKQFQLGQLLYEVILNEGNGYGLIPYSIMLSI